MFNFLSLKNSKRTISTLLPVCVAGFLGMARPLAADSSSPTTPIEHVVVIFQENVSFDHYFATYPKAANSNPAEPHFEPAEKTPSVNGLLAAGLLDKNPNLAQPKRLTRAQAVTCDQNHDYQPEQQAYNFGLMNKFVEFTGSSSSSCDVQGYGNNVVMNYYDGNTVTAFWNYAQHFAMSDNFFNTQFGPSTPGALNLVAGTTHGATVTSGPAAGSVSGGSVTGDPRPSVALDDCTIPSKTLVTMSGTNVGDLLNRKGLTWGWFQGGFTPSSVSATGTATCATAHNNISGASAGTDYIPHHEPFQYFVQTANPHHLPPASVHTIGRTDQANHQYDLTSFFAALKANNLPAVSYLKAAAYQDGHAGYSDPLDEQTFVTSTINEIMHSPAWSSTAIIITYDDSDGWYDHVMAPVVNQSSTSDDSLTGPNQCGTSGTITSQGRCGYGPRLPLLIVSPWAKRNYVDHGVTDQSSVLQLIEDNWNLGRIGGDSTDAVAGSLWPLFNFRAAQPAPRFFIHTDTGMEGSSYAAVK